MDRVVLFKVLKDSALLLLSSLYSGYFRAQRHLTSISFVPLLLHHGGQWLCSILKRNPKDPS